MSIQVVLVVVALVLSFIAAFQSQGRALLPWAAILICVALLWVWY